MQYQQLTDSPDLLLYNSPVSIHAQYARVGLDDIGIEYTKKDVQLPMGQLAPEFARINPKMSIPFLVINDSGSDRKVLTDSRDIAMAIAASFPSRPPSSGASSWFSSSSASDGKPLLPAGKEPAVAAILDYIYSANAGQLAFKAYQQSSPLFRVGLYFVGRLRLQILRQYKKDNADLASIYEEKLTSVNAPEVSFEMQVQGAERVAAHFDQLLQRNGQFLTGSQHTIADLLAAVWLQWVIWSNAVEVSERCKQFLNRAKARPGWNKTMASPNFAPSFVLNRLRLGVFVMLLLVVVIAVITGFAVGLW